jgi:hypothetical protein
LRRLDEAVLPRRWLDTPRDPIKAALQYIYMGSSVLAIGLVLFFVWAWPLFLILGAGNMLIGTARLSGAMRDWRERTAR